MRSPGTCGLRSISPMVALTARSSARVFQYMPFSPARPNGVRTPSTKKTSEMSATLPPGVGFDLSLGAAHPGPESLGANLRSALGALRGRLRGFYKGIGDLLCSLLNLPRTRTELGETAADRVGRRPRGLPGQPAQVLRGQQVLRGHPQLLRGGLDHRPRRL